MDQKLSCGFRELPWDSSHFGFPVATLPGSDFDANEVAGAVNAMRGVPIRTCYALANPKPSNIGALEQAGFRLVDMRVELHHDGCVKGQLSDVRVAEADDYAGLLKMASTAFNHSRFYADSRFPKDRVDAMFMVWISNCLSDPNVRNLVIGETGSPKGFLSLRVGEASSRIELVAVADSAQRQGVGEQLVRSSVEYGPVDVVTQQANMGAMRLYEKCGFQVDRVLLWYHWWNEEL